MIHVSDNPAVSCGEFILKTLQGRNPATLAVSGGSSPKRMFEWMAWQPFDWKALRLFWVDERCVPPDHAESNYRMTREALLEFVRPGAVHRIEAELPPQEAAARYREVLPDRFDLVHLGMGADAHTASLFPGLPEIEDRTGTAAAVRVEKLNAYRVTLLPRMILGAQKIVVLATGADKRATLQRVFSEAYNPMVLPIQLVADRADWFLDPAASGDGFPQAA